MNPTKALYIILFFATIFVFFSCGNRLENPEAIPADPDELHEDANTVEFSSAQTTNAGIELGIIEQKQISGTIKVNGTLDVPPQQLVSISVPLGGFLKNTSLLEGTKVRKGQIIATIENLDFIQIQQDYLEARSQLEQAQADYDRQQLLARENVNSQKTLQQSKTNFSTWQARASGLREKLRVINVNVGMVENGNLKSSINLYAPIDGYVTEVNGNIGKFMNPSDVLFEIVDTEHLHAELIVFEKDVPKLKIGQKVRFTLANETKERTAIVYLIGRAISSDRTIQIHCHIDKEDKDLLPGMYLSALVETGGALVPALPNEAIIDYQGMKFIFVAHKEKAETYKPQENDTPSDKQSVTEETQHFTMLEVQTSHSEFGFTEIVVPDSLFQYQVVIKGAYSILSKMKNSEEGGYGY
ncbi:MAG: efflux RND transporter periplasmic adaptor subunit [Cyclobacteriaceae bacterium]